MSLWQPLAAVEHRLRFVQAGPIRTRVLEAGSGAETLIFLHGSGGHLEAWNRNIAAHAEHFRTLAIDLLGHGYTDRPDRDYQIADYCEHLLDLFDALDLERVHFSGESLGGWIAAAFAARHPHRVGKLILNTPAGLTADEAALTRQREVFLKAGDDPSRENIRKRLEWLVADPATITEDLVDMRHAIYNQPGFPQTLRHVVCLMEIDGRRRNMLDDEDLRRIEAPALVLWTAHNPTDGIAVGEHAAETIPDARLAVMEDCGHWPQFEDHVAFDRLQLDFLTGVM